MPTKKDQSLELMRHLLGSISLDDVHFAEEQQESVEERKAYCAAIAGVFSRLEKDLKRFLYAQLLFASNQADNWDRVVFGRGTFNGIALLLEHWKKASDEHQANSKPAEDFDRHNPVAEI